MDILTVTGNHFECGKQIGEKLHDLISQVSKYIKNDPPNGFTWDQTINQARPYLNLTKNKFPYIVDELEGVAKGSGVPLLDIFTIMVEELWSKPTSPAKACTDVVLTSPVTRDGGVLVGHNNDLPLYFSDKIIPVIWKFDDGCSLFTVGPCGFYMSVGANSFGLVLTGSELTPTDNKIGIPRSLLARAMLSSKTIKEATQIAILPERASSYNNIVSSQKEVTDIEGSATNYAILKPVGGVLVHSNHYLSPKMLAYENEPNYISSIERQKRLEDLIRTTPKPIGVSALKELLKSHFPGRKSNNTICRHSKYSKTCFSFIADMETGDIELALGNPCEENSVYQAVWHIPKDKSFHP